MHALDEVDNRRHLRSVKLEDLELMSLRIYELSRDKVFAMEIDFFLWIWRLSIRSALQTLLFENVELLRSQSKNAFDP